MKIAACSFRNRLFPESLTNDETGFNQEKKDIFRAALEHTPFQQIDDTTVRVNGKNQYSQILCNPYYTAFFTVPRKDRLTILDLLLCGRERTYRFDLKAFCLMSDFNVAKESDQSAFEFDRRQGNF